MARCGNITRGRPIGLVLLLQLMTIACASADGASAVSDPAAEYARVEAVHSHINRLKRVTDARQWGMNDYWATPAELLRAGGGDCEDLAIAKYFALRELGVPVERLRLVYARVFDTRRRLIEPHVVLWYRPETAADWRVLDSLMPRIQTLAQRGDLLPQLTFNERQVAHWRGSAGESLLGGPERIARWQQLLHRQTAERLLVSTQTDPSS